MIALATKTVDVGQLLNVVETALIAGIGVPAVFSLVIFGSVRAGDARRHGRPLTAGLHVVLAVLALAACIAAVAFGISVMLRK